MFLNYIKEFFVKKSLKNDLNNVKIEAFTSNIQTVGLLVDESDFQYSEVIVEELQLNGIRPKTIKIVSYTAKFKEREEYSNPTFGKKHINWKGEITENFLTDFIETEFDLLISYYDVEKTILMIVTNKSKAKFKVGFAPIDKKLKRWMIATTIESYKLFISELFKYLKNIK